MKFNRKQCARARILVLCGSLLSAHAAAEDYLDGRVTVNAYGTFGVAIASDSDTEMYRSISRNGPPLTKDATTSFDTRAGLQIEGHLHEQVDVVWQGLLSRNLEDNTALDTKWAYLRLRPFEWLDVKLGRYLLPLYQISDQLYVGYAHPWVRPPLEVYGITEKVDHADGISVRALWAHGDVNYEFGFTWGQYRDDHDGTKVVTDPRTFSVMASKGNLSVRGMVAHAPVDIENSFFTTLNGVLNGPGATKKYDLTGEDDVWYYNLGFVYEDADWLAMAEALQTDLSDNHAISENRAYSVTLGRHLGDWMPYLAYSHHEIINDESDAFAPPPFNGPPFFIGATRQAFINQRLYGQQTTSLGVRWDFHPGYALKFQADTTRVHDDDQGLFSPKPRGNVRTYTMVLDWVW